MDHRTVAVYEDRGDRWAARARPVRSAGAEAFGASVAPGGWRVDLGCGAGRYSAALGSPLVGVDAAKRMLEQCRSQVPGAHLVQADLEALPFRDRALRGGWAAMSYLHVPRTRLPLALADLHRSLAVGAPVDVQVLAGTYEGRDLPADDLGGRYFAAWDLDELSAVLIGAGFDVHHIEAFEDTVVARATRARTLADTVGAGMRLLVCGLNPSIMSADVGTGFARPGNRFWPAAIAAGLASRPRDPLDALRRHGTGMTDLVKRATVAAAELTSAEYERGLARVEWLCRWLQPGAVCFVGLAGWRATVDRKAAAGVQPQRFGGVPAYVMPSTSGLNAHSRPADLADHLRAASALAGAGARVPRSPT